MGQRKKERKKERKRRSVNSAKSFGLMPHLRHGQGKSADNDEEEDAHMRRRMLRHCNYRESNIICWL